MKPSNSSFFHTIEKLASIRHKFELTLIEQMQQNTVKMFSSSTMINSGLDLAKIIVNRRFAFEKDVLSQIQKKNSTINAEEISSEVKSAARFGDVETIQVITACEPHLVTIPFLIHNYDETTHIFTLVGGEIIDIDQAEKTEKKLIFEPTQLAIDGQQSGEVKLMIEIQDEKFQVDKRYIAAFQIKSNVVKRINIIINIVDKNEFDARPYPIIKMLHLQ